MSIQLVAFGPSLATCSEASLLVPGSVAALWDDATVLEQRSGALASQAEDVRRATPSTWTGTASQGWAQRRTDLGSILDAAGEAHRIAASVLRNHADAVEWAQGRAWMAVQLWAHGCRLRAAAGLPPVGLVAAAPFDTDPGAIYRQTGEDVLASARDHAGESGRAAAAVLAELDDGLPDGKWHSGDFLSAVGSWVAGMADVIWRFGVLREVIDPDGYLDDVSRAFASVADTWGSVTRDPFSAAIQLADLKTLADRPARWWGGLAPDIALAVVGGAGVATKTVSGLRAARDLAAIRTVEVSPVEIAQLLADNKIALAELELELSKDGRAAVSLERVLVDDEPAPAVQAAREWPETPEPGTPEYALGYDHAIAKFRPGEYDTVTRLMDQYGLDLVRAPPKEGGPDWIDPSTGKTYDAVGNFPGRLFDRAWPHLQERILGHMDKADVVPVDVAQFSVEQTEIVKKYVEQFGDRVLIVGE